MLTENDIIKAVCRHVRRHDYEIERTASTWQRGIDIVATKKTSRRTLYVEAKGETTSKKSARAGKCFSRAQCKTHLAVAVLAAMKVRDAEIISRNRVSAIALPNVAPHPELVKAIQASLNDLRIGIFWVSERGRVHLDASWRL